MAKCKSCKCCRIVSPVCSKIDAADGCCRDVCTNPICGTPGTLGIFAPVIYDELGINLCATFPVGITVSTEYPTAVSACVRLVNLTYTYGTADGEVNIQPIAGRPNCTRITLSNIVADYVIIYYDSSCNTLGTSNVSATYLPSDQTSTFYDGDTNPSSVTLEMYTPYGYSYNLVEGGNPTAAINNIGFDSTNNSIREGLNLYGIPKVLDFDEAASEITVGLTLVMQTLYFAGYRVPVVGRMDTPKGSITSDEESVCMDFVAGELLNLAIRPLNLSPPACEGVLKQDCDPVTPCCGCDEQGEGNCIAKTEVLSGTE